MNIIAAIILSLGITLNTFAIIGYAELKFEQLLDK